MQTLFTTSGACIPENPHALLLKLLGVALLYYGSKAEDEQGNTHTRPSEKACKHDRLALIPVVPWEGNAWRSFTAEQQPAMHVETAMGRGYAHVQMLTDAPLSHLLSAVLQCRHIRAGIAEWTAHRLAPAGTCQPACGLRDLINRAVVLVCLNPRQGLTESWLLDFAQGDTMCCMHALVIACTQGMANEEMRSRDWFLPPCCKDSYSCMQ